MKPVQKWMRNKLHRLVPIVVALSLMLGGVVISASPAFAVGSYNNADIATDALSHLDENLGEVSGQCKQFVNDMVKAASNNTQSPSSYQSGWAALGTEVAPADAVKGDIIQITPAGSNDDPKSPQYVETLYNYDDPSMRLHTTIIVANNGNDSFSVVDANFTATYTVGQHTFNPYTWAYNTTTHTSAIIKIWRLGTVSDSGTHVNRRLMGDTNGDGKADAVVVFGQTGNTKVALSTGSSFGYPGDWSYGQDVNATDYWLADVDGDGKADLVAYYKSLRKWFVSISSGSGFWSPVEWSYDDPSFGDYSRAFFGDVNGDGKADKIEFVASSGNWFVSISSGSGFWSLQSAIGGYGVGSTDQFVADFNGDGKADAGVYEAGTGNWYVAPSMGSSFGYPGQWSAGHGLGTTFRLVGDATGDGKADAIYYSNNIYKFWVGASSGSGFWGLAEWSYDGPAYVNPDNAFAADVNGDGKADKILWFTSSGGWYVALSSGSGYWPLNLWIAGHGAGS